MIRSSWITILLKFRNKAALKEQGNLSLSLRRGQQLRWSWLRGLEWLKLASRCLKTLAGTSSEQQQLDRELWEHMLNVRRFSRKKTGFYLARLHFLISSSYLQGLMHRHLHCWMLAMMMIDKTHNSTRCASCGDSLCFVSFHIFCKFFASINISLVFWSRQIVQNFPHNSNIAFMGKSLSTYDLRYGVAHLGNNCVVTSGDDCI